jgi:Protein of unknown function (DUF4236)
MGFRYRRRWRLFPGMALNLSKSAISLSVGRSPFTINLNRQGVQGTAGLPGSGISYRTKRRKIGSSARPLASRHKRSFWALW